jgi:hypothetical protein
MRKLFLNLTPGEPLALMNKFAYFDKLIEFDSLLEGTLCLGVHDLIKCIMFNAGRVEFCRGKLLGCIGSVKEGRKIWLDQFHIKYWVKAKEMRNT